MVVNEAMKCKSSIKLLPVLPIRNVPRLSRKRKALEPLNLFTKTFLSQDQVHKTYLKHFTSEALYLWVQDGKNVVLLEQ